MMDLPISINRAAQYKEKPPLSAFVSGQTTLFTDHMFVAEYADGRWGNARIQPYAPFSIDPASPVLHYAQEIFEGMKAFRAGSGDILLFRAIENARRMNRSALRMCMPELDAAFQLKAIELLVDLERAWVPDARYASLYIRPTMIADGAMLGVSPASRYLYYVICGPSVTPDSGAPQAKRIYVEDTYVRTVRGGVGEAKTGGNYAAGLFAMRQAKQRGYDQVLWLDGRENKYVEEIGAMNMFFFLGNTLVTPALNGSILHGITRDSVLTLAREMGIAVEEREIGIRELLAAYRSGDFLEAFGTGTASSVAPVGEFCYKGETMLLNEGKPGKRTMALYGALTALQYGEKEDTHGWVTRVPNGGTPS